MRVKKPEVGKTVKAGLVGLLAGAAGVGSAAALGNRLYDQLMTPPGHADAPADDPVALGKRWVMERPNRRDVILSAVDGLALHAHWLPAPQDTHRWVICVHGYGRSGAEMGHFASHYADQGWNLLLPDLRGHGESEGNYVGFGWDDRLDLVSWVSWIVRRDPQAWIVLHGLSMGAAAVLLTTGGALPQNVKGAVSDCSYTSASALLRLILHKSHRWPGPAGTALAALRSAVKRRAKYDLDKADALNAVRRSHTPTLFIHGVSDELIPAAMMAELYEHARCPKEFLWVPHAGHGRALLADSELYWSTVDDFIARLEAPTEN